MVVGGSNENMQEEPARWDEFNDGNGTCRLPGVAACVLRV